MPSKTMPVLLIVGVVTLAVVGGGILLLSTDGSEKSPTLVDQERPSPNDWTYAEKPRVFLWGDRRIEVKNRGQDEVVAYFVPLQARGSAVNDARSCVRTQLARFSTATCYAFESVPAIDAAEPARTGDAMTNACWTAAARGLRTATTEGIKIVESGPNSDYDEESCAPSDDPEVAAMPRVCLDPDPNENVIVGTEDSDTLNGTEGSDIICGGDGDDVINGAGGNDLIVGNDGDDTISGGAGKDNISGDAGDDSLTGEDDNDLLKGNAGSDTLEGNTGIDALVGGGGADVMHGGPGRNQCLGNARQDRFTRCE